MVTPILHCKSSGFHILVNKHMTHYITEKDGRRRKATEIICDHCGSTFLKAINRVSDKNYCTVECAHHARTNRVVVTCSGCHTDIQRARNELTKSKSGLYFCSRSCKDEAQRIGGIKEIQPPHYGTKTNRVYRDIAFTHYKPECVICGFDKVIHVHHIDGNHTNDCPSNLIPLCPNHHGMAHMTLYEEEIYELIQQLKIVK